MPHETHELSEADVQFISLVKRGANRIPFRITKNGDQQMIDLSSIFKREPVKPAVYGIAVRKGAELDLAKQRIEAAGFSTENVEEHDTATLFKQIEGEPEGVVYFKVDEDFAIGVTHLAKQFSGFEFDSNDFKEVMAVEGFFPGVGTAMEVLRGTIGNIMQKADDNTEASERIGAAIDDFKVFMTAMAKDIPMTAFKFETVKVEKGEAGSEADAENKGSVEAAPRHASEPTPDQAASADAVDAVFKNEDGEGAEAAAAAGAGEGTGEGESEEEAAAAAAADADPAPAGDQGSAGLEQILKETKSLIESLKGDLSKEIAGVQETVSGLSGRLDTVEQVAKAAKDAVGGIVAGKSPGEKVQASKMNGSGGVPPLLDTGYMPLK